MPRGDFHTKMVNFPQSNGKYEINVIWVDGDPGSIGGGRRALGILSTDLGSSRPERLLVGIGSDVQSRGYRKQRRDYRASAVLIIVTRNGWVQEVAYREKEDSVGGDPSSIRLGPPIVSGG